MSLVNEVRNKIFEALEQEVNYKSYAIFRSCLAFCTFLTFIFNDTDVIFPKFKIDKFYNTINTFGLFWGNVVIQNILLYKVICIFILLFGIILHICIIFVHGIFTFSLVMISCLFFYFEFFKHKKNESI